MGGSADINSPPSLYASPFQRPIPLNLLHQKVPPLLSKSDQPAPHSFSLRTDIIPPSSFQFAFVYLCIYLFAPPKMGGGVGVANNK